MFVLRLSWKSSKALFVLICLQRHVHVFSYGSWCFVFFVLPREMCSDLCIWVLVYIFLRLPREICSFQINWRFWTLSVACLGDCLERYAQVCFPFFGDSLENGLWRSYKSLNVCFSDCLDGCAVSWLVLVFCFCWDRLERYAHFGMTRHFLWKNAYVYTHNYKYMFTETKSLAYYPTAFV